MQPGLVTRDGHYSFVLQEVKGEMSPLSNKKEWLQNFILKLAHTDTKVKSI